MSEKSQIRPVATEFLRLRPVLVAPFLVFTLATMAIARVPSRQVIALACFGGLAVGFFFYERRRGAQRLVDGSTFLRSLVATLVALAIACSATGAIASPFVPMLFAPVGVGFAAFGRSRRSIVLFVVLALVVGLLVALAEPLAPLALPESARRLVLGAAVLCAATLLFAGVASLAAAHARAGESLLIAGEEMVRSAEARTKELELTGERVAHEVKNPLTAVRALIELMRESADERTQKRLGVAVAEVDRIERIIDGYRSVTHPLDTIQRTRVDVGEMLSAIVAILEPRAEREGVALSIASMPSGAFSLDRDRTREALMNLVLNALAATPPGGTVTIAARIDDDGLTVEVRDTGVGMDEAALAKVGTPFFTARTGGTGLGAAHARRVAVQHGGTLDWTSTKDAGTTARLRLPS